MNVVLVHPIHGAKIATHPQEIEMDKKNGWTEYTPAAPVEGAPKAEKPVRNKLTRRVTEKPGGIPSFLTPVSDEPEGY